MSEVLDAPQAQTAVAKIDLKALALSRFGDWRPAAEAIVAKYKGVLIDATTPKGYKALTEAIAEVRAPRYAAQNVSKASKSELAGVSKAVGVEEAAVAAFLEATEAELVAQKDAEDARRAAEEKRLKDIEEARVAGYQARIAGIRECVAKARGISAARIANGIAAVAALVIDDTWQEFVGPALAAQVETLQALNEMHAAQVAAEADAAAREAQRVEQARVAAEQAAEAARLAEAREMIAKADREAKEKLDADRAEFAREQAEWRAKLTAATAPAPEPAPAAPAAPGLTIEPPIPAPTAAPVQPPEPERALYHPLTAEAAPVPPALREEPTLSLGDIKDRIAPLSITADGLAQLGFPCAASKGATRLYFESSWPEIKAAIIKHVEAA